MHFLVGFRLRQRQQVAEQMNPELGLIYSPSPTHSLLKQAMLEKPLVVVAVAVAVAAAVVVVVVVVVAVAVVVAVLVVVLVVVRRHYW